MLFFITQPHGKIQKHCKINNIYTQFFISNYYICLKKQTKMLLDVLCSLKNVNPIQPQRKNYVCKMCKYETPTLDEYEKHKKTTIHITKHNKIEKEWQEFYEAILLIG